MVSSPTATGQGKQHLPRRWLMCSSTQSSRTSCCTQSRGMWAQTWLLRARQCRINLLFLLPGELCEAAREQGAMNIWLSVEMKRKKGHSTKEGQRKNPRGESGQMMKYSSSVQGKLCNLQEIFRLMNLSALLGSAVVRSEPGCCDWSGICGWWTDPLLQGGGP